ncbi:hypothetical protein E8E14_013122 [Neopestalotiopsis sp. 37M]|nr:hypothetical protein E8E14_013122 [Neopestalotiopsis sp. 37M]
MAKHVAGHLRHLALFASQYSPSNGELGESSSTEDFASDTVDGNSEKGVFDSDFHSPENLNTSYETRLVGPSEFTFRFPWGDVELEEDRKRRRPHSSKSVVMTDTGFVPGDDKEHDTPQLRDTQEYEPSVDEKTPLETEEDSNLCSGWFHQSENSTKQHTHIYPLGNEHKLPESAFTQEDTRYQTGFQVSRIQSFEHGRENINSSDEIVIDDGKDNPDSPTSDHDYQASGTNDKGKGLVNCSETHTASLQGASDSYQDDMATDTVQEDEQLALRFKQQGNPPKMD